MEEAAIEREARFARKAALREYETLKGGEIKNIVWPEYELDERIGCFREVRAPPPLLFEELGWDPEPNVTKVKHYRAFTNRELELTRTYMSKPSEFDTFQLKRGQARGASSGLFGGGKKDQATGEADTTQVVGRFKALIQVHHKATEMEKKMALQRKLAKIRDLLA